MPTLQGHGELAQRDQGVWGLSNFIDDFLSAPQRDIGPTKRKGRVTPATILRRETIKAIQQLKHLGSRPCIIPIYTGQIEHDGKKYLVGRPGASDLCCCFMGKFIAIELKAKADRVSPRQEKFAERVAQAGGVYVVVRTAQDAVDALMKVYNESQPKLP